MGAHVLKLKEFRDLVDAGKPKTADELQNNMLKQLVLRKARKNQQKRNHDDDDSSDDGNNGFGGFGRPRMKMPARGRFGGGMFGNPFGNQFNQPQQHSKKKKESQYGDFGEQNALHLAQGYAHPKLVNFILTFHEVEVNRKDHLGQTPLFLYIVNQGQKLYFYHYFSYL